MGALAGSPARAGASLLVAGVSLVFGARALGHLFYDPTLWALAGWVVPPDFGDFYQAADAVLRGASPYQLVFADDQLGYVYPPLLAWLITPLTLLSVPAAVSAWAALSVLFVVAAMWVLGVRDWRCYPLALLWPFNREAIEFGAIDGLLVLAVALAWRYRDAPVRASAAAGFSVALKLFVWPLALWFALSGRLRTALFTCVAVAGFVLLPWALIGFQGIGRYTALLTEVADQQSGSYSLAAMAEELDFATTFARTVSVAVAVWLLFLVFAAARADNAQPVRDRRSFTLTIAAALVLTPVLWNHYLLLLIVPVALARPRLSGLWVLPLAANCLYLFDWYGPKPQGLLPLLAIGALTATTFVLAVEAQARPRTNVLRALWIRAKRYRFWQTATAGFAAAVVFAVAFVLVPEKLNDRPYNPLGRDTSHVKSSEHGITVR